MEEWKVSKNWPGYSISSQGRARSEIRVIIRSNGRPHTAKPKILASHKDSQGYLQFHPYRDKKRYHVLMHREVFETFVRPLELEEQIDHLDSSKVNNCIENLQAVSGHTEHSKLTIDRMQQKWFSDGFDAGYAAALEDVKKLQIS